MPGLWNFGAMGSHPREKDFAGLLLKTTLNMIFQPLWTILFSQLGNPFSWWVTLRVGSLLQPPCPQGGWTWIGSLELHSLERNSPMVNVLSRYRR